MRMCRKCMTISRNVQRITWNVKYEMQNAKRAAHNVEREIRNAERKTWNVKNIKYKNAK